MFSNFVVKYGDGTLQRIPVMYGDADRQVASIIRNNSENAINSVPRIAVYVTGLDIDSDRLSDATYIGKTHIRERDYNTDGTYNQAQGKNYTVERLMPTPFKLTMKVDIWSANTDQKLQILEQILVLFNPSLELQTSDNFVDWTALTVLNLGQINWSSRTVPVGADSPIDIATLTVNTPIWISPPVKVKHLGVITKIITSLFGSKSESGSGYIEGLGADLGSGTVTFSDLLSSDAVTIGGFGIQVYNGQAKLLNPSDAGTPDLEIIPVPGQYNDWQSLFDQYPGKYVDGSSRIFLMQPDGSEVMGYVAINVTDPTLLAVDWDNSTFPVNDDIVTTGDRLARNLGNDTFDAIIDPQKVYPGHGMTDVLSGDRFLIIEDIGSTVNEDGPDGWKNGDGSDFVAKANDIIEWQTDRWAIIFDSQVPDQHIYQTNTYNGKRVQYVWNNVSWAKSFEGEYRAANWRIVL